MLASRGCTLSSVYHHFLYRCPVTIGAFLPHLRRPASPSSSLLFSLLLLPLLRYLSMFKSVSLSPTLFPLKIDISSSKPTRRPRWRTFQDLVVRRQPRFQHQRRRSVRTLQRGWYQYRLYSRRSQEMGPSQEKQGLRLSHGSLIRTMATG